MKLSEIKDLAQEAKKQSLLASKQKKQDDDLWEVNSDLENWKKPL